MALVEIEAGAHRITAVVTRDSVEELGLSENDQVFARFQATSVMAELDNGASTNTGSATPSRQ
jgi:molybdopterin-binding protein